MVDTRPQTQNAYDWRMKNRDTFEREGNALILKVSMETAVRIKDLSYECSVNCLSGESNGFDEQKWEEGLYRILDFHLPPLRFGETYKMVICK